MTNKQDLFRNIESPTHRAWNQLNKIRNLEETHGDEASGGYFEQLTQNEQINVLAVAARILVKGEDFVRAEVNKSI